MNSKILEVTKKYNIAIYGQNDFKEKEDMPEGVFMMHYMDDPLEFGEAYLVRLMKRQGERVINSFGKSRLIQLMGVDEWFVSSMDGMDDKLKG